MIRRWFPAACAAVAFVLLMRGVDAAGPPGGAEEMHLERAKGIAAAVGAGDMRALADDIRAGGSEAPFGALWTSVFLAVFGPEARSARMGSAAAFLLAILLLHSLVRRRGGGREAAPWVLLFGLSSGLATLVARTATPWPVGLLLLAASLAAVVEAQHQGGALRAGAAGLVAGAAALGAGPLWPWLTGGFLVHGLWSGFRSGGGPPFAMGPYVGGLAILPLWWHLVGSGSAEPGIPLVLAGGWPGGVWTALMGGWASFSIPSLLLQGAGLLLLVRSGGPLGRLAGCLAAAGAAGWILTEGRQPEWLLPCLAVWWAAGAHALGRVFGRVRRPRERLGFGLLACVAVLMTSGRGVRSLVRVTTGHELPVVVVRDWTNLYGPRILTGPQEGP